MAGALAQLLTKDMIRLKIDAADWQEALRLGGDLLIKTGGVEPRYLDAMINMMLEMGPFVVIAPGLALGHARPEEGAIKTCFSLITLKQGVEFGVPENDPVDVIFSFAAPNKEAHIDALRDLALLCREQKNMDAIRTATEPEEVLALLA